MSFTINNFLDYQTLLQATEHRRFREQTVTVAERKGALWVRFYRDGVGGSRIKVTGSCRTRASATVDCSAVDTLRRARMASINLETHQASTLKAQSPKHTTDCR